VAAAFAARADSGRWQLPDKRQPEVRMSRVVPLVSAAVAVKDRAGRLLGSASGGQLPTSPCQPVCTVAAEALDGYLGQEAVSRRAVVGSCPDGTRGGVMQRIGRLAGILAAERSLKGGLAAVHESIMEAGPAAVPQRLGTVGTAARFGTAAGMRNEAGDRQGWRPVFLEIRDGDRHSSPFRRGRWTGRRHGASGRDAGSPVDTTSSCHLV
jgi:hypothetical protein